MKKHNYLSSPAYRKWVLARDKALEELHIRAQLEATDEMRRVLTNVLMAAKASYHDLKNPVHPTQIDMFQSHVFSHMRDGADHLFVIMMRLRARTYLLTRTSETAILLRLNKAKEQKSKIPGHEITHHSQGESFAGGPLYQRIHLYMDRLARNIVSRAQSSAINAPDIQAYLFDVLQAFPPRKVYKRPPRVLKPKLLTEADPMIGIGVGTPDWLKKYNQARGEGATSAEATQLLDVDAEAQWQEMLDAYKSEYIPEWRAPEYLIDIPVTDPTIQATGEEVWYAWEFERDMTNEFVQAVRDGQIKAAKDVGITDFVWIAVLDSVTDSCCRWRDGLLVSEIKEQLSEHQSEDDECRLDNDGLTPPIHFNCRCTLAPASENIPDKPDSNESDFNEWLEGE